MPFEATWMHLEIIILSEVNQRQISYDIAYMWNLKEKIQVNLFTKQIHRLREPSYGHQGISEGDRLEIWDWRLHTAIFKIDSQQGPTV